MKFHEEDTALLDAYVDGELTPEEMAEVQAHLDRCPECQAYVEDALAMRAAFPTEDSLPLPEDFTKHVMEAVAKHPQSRPKKQPWGKLAAAAACLAVLVLVQRGGLAVPASGGTANTAAPETASYSLGIPADAALNDTATEDAPASADVSEGTDNGAAVDSVSGSAPEAAPAETNERAVQHTKLPTVRISAGDLGDLLSDRTPEETTEDTARYYFTEAEFQLLQSQLNQQGISLETPPEDCSGGVLVEVYDA